MTVTYELTDLGRSLQAVVELLKDWAEGHMGEVLAARDTYDSSALTAPRVCGCAHTCGVPWSQRSSSRWRWSPAAVATAGTSGGDGGDFTEQSADEISDAAKDAMADLEAVTIDGTLSSDGQEIDITMSIGSGGDCTGSFGTQGATAEILGVDGTVWFRPDAAFWGSTPGPRPRPRSSPPPGTGG